VWGAWCGGWLVSALACAAGARRRPTHLRYVPPYELLLHAADERLARALLQEGLAAVKLLSQALLAVLQVLGHLGALRRRGQAGRRAALEARGAQTAEAELRAAARPPGGAHSLAGCAAAALLHGRTRTSQGPNPNPTPTPPSSPAATQQPSSLAWQQPSSSPGSPPACSPAPPPGRSAASAPGRAAGTPRHTCPGCSACAPGS
jgi:hypothetical protein